MQSIPDEPTRAKLIGEYQDYHETYRGKGLFIPTPNARECAGRFLLEQNPLDSLATHIEAITCDRGYWRDVRDLITKAVTS